MSPAAARPPAATQRWPLRPNARQALVALLGLVAGLTVFIALQRVVVPRYVWVTRLDEQIPFVAQSWWLYVAFFPFVVLAAAYASADRFRRFSSATCLAFGVALVCFWLFPNMCPGPIPLRSTMPSCSSAWPGFGSWICRPTGAPACMLQ